MTIGRECRIMADNFAIMLTSLVFFFCRKVGLSSKYPYRLILMGKPLWWVLDGKIEEIGGFYTTRFVMASSSEEATARAVRIVTNDIQRIARNPPGSPVRIQTEECSKLDGFVTRRGAGFAFWPREGGSGDRWQSRH